MSIGRSRLFGFCCDRIVLCAPLALARPDRKRSRLRLRKTNAAVPYPLFLSLGGLRSAASARVIPVSVRVPPSVFRPSLCTSTTLTVLPSFLPSIPARCVDMRTKCRGAVQHPSPFSPRAPTNNRDPRLIAHPLPRVGRVNIEATGLRRYKSGLVGLCGPDWPSDLPGLSERCGREKPTTIAHVRFSN